MSAPAVEMHGVTHRYGSAPVLQDVDLTIEHGEVFGFLGHNGAGKTTTVNILTTLLRPTSGRALVCGFDVVQQRVEVTRRIGYVPADVRLYDHLSAAENLEFFARLSGVRNPRGAVERALDYLGCLDLAGQRLGTFSTGMRQRIGIAQAILHEPEVLFLDEPTSGLDPAGTRQLRATVLRLNRELGMTVVMNTHVLHEVARVCSTIGVLNHGRLVYKDTIEATTARFPDESSLEDIYAVMAVQP